MIRRRYLYAVAFCSGMAFASHALEVYCAPGELRSLIEKPSEVAELTVRGNIDASDLYFIGTDMPSLKNLDLSGVGIAASTCTAPSGRAESWPSGAFPDGVFAGSAIESIRFPEFGLISVGSCAFMDSKLRTVEIPTGDFRFGEAAFAACRELTSVRIPASAKSGGYLFHRCNALKTADISGFAHVGDSDFSDCSALVTVTGTDGLMTIGKESFARTSISELDFSGSRSLSSIGDWAFSDNKSLVSAALPSSASIAFGKGMFFGCGSLQAVSLPATATEIPAYTLAGAESLLRLVLPGGISEVGESAMEGMGSLEVLDGTALEEVPTTGADVWRGVDQPSAKLRVASSIAGLFSIAPQWKEFDIVPVASSTADVAVAGISLRFEGYDLIISSAATDIDSVCLYDISGRQLLRADIHSAQGVIDTSHLGGNIFIVQCRYGGGATASFKLIRNN